MLKKSLSLENITSSYTNSYLSAFSLCLDAEEKSNQPDLRGAREISVLLTKLMSSTLFFLHGISMEIGYSRALI